MIDHYKDSIPTILMADRGYENFNVSAHLIRKNMNFVIRLKDINSNGILSAYDLTDTEFDFLDEYCTEYDIEFRIVRILLNNESYICIATNLSEEEFPLEEIKKLYRMRWTEETSFRELKYTIGLVNWHSSKYEGILQEINAHIISSALA